MAKRLQEQFFNVGQAPKIATEAQDVSGLKLAEALSGLLGDTASAANTFTSIYASQQKQELSEARRQESEARRKEAEAKAKRREQVDYEVAQEFNQLGPEEFLKKYETVSVVGKDFTPDEQKQAVINQQVATINLGKFKEDLNTAQKNYQNKILNDPTLTYKQQEVDVIGQNLLEKYLRQGGNNPFYMTSFYPRAVTHLSTNVQGQHVSKSKQSFENHNNKLVNGIYATVNYMPPIVSGSEEFTKAASVFGYDSNTTNEQEIEVIQLYHKSKTLLDQVDEARRQQKIITGEADDGSIMKNLFDNLAVNGEVDLMEAVLNLPIKDMGLLYKDAPGYGDDLFKTYIETKQKQNNLQDSETVRNANQLLVEDAKQIESLISNLQTSGAENYRDNLNALNQTVDNSLDALNKQIRLVRNTGNEALTRSLVDYKTYLEEVQSGKHSHSSTDNFEVVKELNRRRIDGENYRNYLLNNMDQLTLETFQEYNSFERKNLNDVASRFIITEFSRMLPNLVGADLDAIMREIANLTFQDPGNPVIKAFNEAKEYITEILPSQYSLYYGSDVSTRQAIKKDAYLNNILEFAREAVDKPDTEMPQFETAITVNVPAFINMSPEEQVKDFYSMVDGKPKYSVDEKRFLFRVITEGDSFKAREFKEALLEDRSESLPPTEQDKEKVEGQRAVEFIVGGESKSELVPERTVQQSFESESKKIAGLRNKAYLNRALKNINLESISTDKLVDIVFETLSNDIPSETALGRKLSDKEVKELEEQYGKLSPEEYRAKGYSVTDSGVFYSPVVEGVL